MPDILSSKTFSHSSVLEFSKKTKFTFILVCFLVFTLSERLSANDSVDYPPVQSLPTEEIIVTARKLEESIQKVPISITALSEDLLRQKNLTNLIGIDSFVPNLDVSTGPRGSGGNNTQVYIRGVGQSDFLFTSDPGVGIYLDGVYLPRSLGGALDLLDIERVEVLRGPQGTLFGKNTIGGAINVITNKPTHEFAGSAEITFGSFDRQDLRLNANIPVSEVFSTRFSVSKKDRNGYTDRLDFTTGETIGHQGNKDSFNARASFRWTPSDTTTLDVIFDHTREREEASPTSLLQFDPNASLASLWNNLVGVPNGSTMSAAFVSGDKHQNFGTGPNQDDLDVDGINITFEHKFDGVTLKTITSYREMEAVFGRDGDGSPNNYISTTDIQSQEQFSQEIHWLGSLFEERLDWLFGLFYMQEQGIDENDVRLASGLYDALEAQPLQINGAPCIPPWVAPGCVGNPINTSLDLDFDIFNKIEIESYAIFSHFSYKLTNHWALNAGVRYTQESKDYTLEHLRINSGVPIVPLTTVSDTFREISPKIGLDYQHNEHILTYTTVSQGFKSGGFNGRPTTSSEVESFDSEVVTTYELGIKAKPAQSSVRLNAAVFYMEYKDMQLNSLSTDSSSNLIHIVDNAAEARLKGLEVEFLALLNSHWMVSGGFGYIDAEYTDIGNAEGITTDSKFVKTPEKTINAAAQYTLMLDSKNKLSFRMDWRYKSRVYNDIQNTDVLTQPAHSLLDARLAFQHENDWELVLSGINLTDEIYLINGIQALESFGTAEGTFSSGRQWALNFRMYF